MRAIFLLCTALLSGCAGAQPIDSAWLKNITGDTWYDKVNDRYIALFSDDDTTVTVNDWSHNPDRNAAMTDAYRVYLENGRLIFPEDTEHHAPRCEMELQGQQLIYRCDGRIPGLDFEMAPTLNVFERLKDNDT